MLLSRRRFGVIAIATCAVIATLIVVVLRPTDPTPLTLDPALLEHWTVVAGEGASPWVVALRPPAALTDRLFAAVRDRAGSGVMSPAHADVPLVLRREFEDGLQGVYGRDSLMRIARDAGIETAAWHPVCLAHKTSENGHGRADLYFVPFESVVFGAARVEMVPLQPEQAGIGIYEPGALSPVLVVAATGGDLAPWLPVRFEPADCAVEFGGP